MPRQERTQKPERPSKPEKKQNKLSRMAFVILCLIIIITFAALIRGQAVRYNNLRVQNDRIQAELAREEAIYRDLRYQIAHFDSDAYIEELARTRLGWVRPNEIVFRKITD
ncbi:MAG: septum formation initiator family protein [Defluviitaleaceae bacterium]|nr:septum formation initiator family protein [Defluviitaleaceae bacterium]